MKRILVVALVLAFLVSAVPFAATASAEGQRLSGEKLNEITMEILNTLRDEPTGGQIITRSELDAMLAKYVRGISGGGMMYTKTANGDFEKRNNKWELGKDVTRQEMWVQMTGSTYPSTRMEILTLAGGNNPAGTIDVTLIKHDDNFTYMYTWVKWAKEGTLIKIPKQFYKGIPDSTQRKVAEDQNQEGKAIIFDDQTVNQQLCKVYSRTGTNPKLGVSQSSYHWFSTDKGFDIIDASYQREGNKVRQNTMITFEQIGSGLDASLFNPPSDVTFKEDGSDSSRGSGDSDKSEGSKKPRIKIGPFGF
jgi:hypothetical protein